MSATTAGAGSGLGSWRGSWAVALRMARREVRRHRGRSLLALLMVAIPTALLTFALTLYPTSLITGPERIPYELGNAVAVLTTPGSDQIVQDPEAIQTMPAGFSATGPGTTTRSAQPLPGLAKGSTPTPGQLATAMAAQFGGRVVPTTQLQVWILDGDRSRRVDLVATPDPEAKGGLDLVSGRWASGPEEVVVTQTAVDKGLVPTSGTLLLDSTPARTLRIVGVAQARSSWGAPLAGLIAPDTLGEQVDSYMTSYALYRDQPFTWPQVQQANTFGISALSADVLRNPPPSGEIDPDLRDMMSMDDGRNAGLVVAGGAILLIIVTLLVGPAFAVSAARQRRTLALAASNGATTKQLRRTVLSQAVVLGALAAVAGAVIGVLAVPAVTHWIIPVWTPWTGGPLDIPWTHVLGIMAVAMLSALVAALVPAQRLGRLDIVGVMKGQEVSPPPSRVVFLLGLAGAILGGIVLFYGIITHASEVFIVGGAVLLIGGALLLVPTLLGLAALGSQHLPVSLRLASRDAARQRSRSTPSVAAVVGAVAALTMMGVGLTSDTEQQRREYVPNALDGEAIVSLDVYGSDGAPRRVDDVVARTTETIKRTTPGLVVVPLAQVTGGHVFAGPGSDPKAVWPFVNYRPQGCTTTESISGDPDAPAVDGVPKCTQFGTHAWSGHGQIGVLPLAELDRRFHLTDNERTVLDKGGALAFTRAALPASITMVSGTLRVDSDTGEFTDITERAADTLPVATRTLDLAALPALPRDCGLFVTPDTATALGWATTTDAIGLYDPAGPISSADADRLNAAMTDSSYVEVERGFQRADQLIMGILVGIFAFLILVITLTSTALSMAEQQRDDATLAAVGATRGTRRAMAAGQAIVISLLGALIGVAVGLVPGIAITFPLTGNTQCDRLTNMCQEGYAHPIIKIPWLWLGLLVVAVPLTAALVSALAVRRAPTMTRRAT
ncbi:MAG: ABC transporter permease [Actinobacteria bacterium]|nr:ABC transporter permease [Actinomycetota bacterium]